MPFVVFVINCVFFVFISYCVITPYDFSKQEFILEGLNFQFGGIICYPELKQPRENKTNAIKDIGKDFNQNEKGSRRTHKVGF